MGSGSFTLTPQAIPLARPAKQVLVYRYDPESEEYTFLPNIRCLSVEYSEGANPPIARFRYSFGDPRDDGDSPTRAEQVYPLDADGDRVVLNDDEIYVETSTDDGDYDALFEGYASLPQADLNRSAESVTFECMGTPVREWDKPLGGALMRDAVKATTPGADVRTGLPARFNPDGKPNASPGHDTPDDGTYDSTKHFPYATGVAPPDPKFPCFLGPIWPDNKIGNDDIRFWTLGMAARYIIADGLATDDEGHPYLNVGDLSRLDDLFMAYEPTKQNGIADPGGIIDMDDPSTYTKVPIIIDDIDVTGMPWPEALERLIRPHGFNFNFRLDQNSQGDPFWRLEIYRKDTPGRRVQSLYLQSPDGDSEDRVVYDPGKTNANEIRLARDADDVVNQFRVDTAPTQYEASFILAPGFRISPDDAADANAIAAFIDGGEGFTISNDHKNKYRVWVYNECGEGYWDVASDQWKIDPIGKFDDLFEKPPKGGSSFVPRRRPARDQLITVDEEGRPLRAELWVSRRYDGPILDLYDDTYDATWTKVPDSEWELLDDRLGIRFTASNPNSISLGEQVIFAESSLGAKLSLVEHFAIGINSPYMVFRLTCVVESDQCLGYGKDDQSNEFDTEVIAKRRDSSPTKFAVERRIDERSRYVKKIISPYSQYAKTDGLDAGKDFIAYDDTEDAQADADSIRKAKEYGAFAGSVSLVGIRYTYRISDQIDMIVGRNISLRSNLAEEQGESPRYPNVVGVRFGLEGEQTTTLALEDRRDAIPHRRRRASGISDD
jgi:hypothetical protein